MGPARTVSSMLIIFCRIDPLNPPALPFQHIGWIAKQAASITTCGGEEGEEGKRRRGEGVDNTFYQGENNTHTLRPFVSVLNGQCIPPSNKPNKTINTY